MIGERPEAWSGCYTRGELIHPVTAPWKPASQTNIPCEGFINVTAAPAFCTESKYSWVVWRFSGPSNYRIDADIIFLRSLGGQHLIAPVDDIIIYCPDDFCYGFLVLTPVWDQFLGSFFVCTDTQPVIAFAGCTDTPELALFITSLWVLLNSSPGSHPLLPQ